MSKTGWQWHTSRTGSRLRPISTAWHTTQAAETMGRAMPGPGQITVIVDPDDNAQFARTVGRACRRSGRFVVHTSPRQRRAWRLQTEILSALGKHWDRPAQGGDATVAQLARAWLRAERARDLVVLRAHHIVGPALDWLLDLHVQEGLLLWLISPQPLPWTGGLEGVTVTYAGAAAASADLKVNHPAGCGCEDLNDFAAAAPLDEAAVGLTVATARRLRRLYDLEAAALAAATILLSRPTPEALAAARPAVAEDVGTVATAAGMTVAVPEYGQALLRGWAGRPLLPEEWAHDVVATYLTLRLEAAERHTGARLIDPTLPPLPPVDWHERYDPGAQQLAWLTRSAWIWPHGR